MIDFKPSDVDINGSMPPLCATFDRAEPEAAGTLLVRACQFHGDKWAPMALQEVMEAAKSDLDEKRQPLFTLMRNPFWHPDFYALIEKGFARWTEAEKGPIEFTEAGLERLRKWKK